jgi:hypothetical protein
MLRRAIAISCLLAALAPAAAVAATPDGDLALALRHRPRLLFDAKERWRPTDVDRFLAEPGHAACTIEGACVPLVSAAQLVAPIAYLDLRGTRSGGADATSPDVATCAKSLPQLRECDGDGRSLIYAHVVRKRARIAIDYWWFLRYNAYSLDVHEGDWEGVTVVVAAKDERVLEVHFAAHTSVQRYADDVPRIVDGRVKVYVANGDHAAYPRLCTRLCRQTGGVLPESHFGGQRSWIANSAAGCRRRCVRLLPSTSWGAWDGRWGVPPSGTFAAPATPAFQQRYSSPFAAHRSGRHTF